MKNLLRGILLFGIIILVTQGCVTQRRCLEKFSPASTRDSVYIEKLKEIPVYLPGDTLEINVPVNCPDQDIGQFEFSKLRQQLLILHGKLISKTQIRPDTIRVFVPEIRTEIKEVKVTVPEPVKYIPHIYKTALWGWIIIILSAGGYLLLRFKFGFFKTKK